MIVFRFAVSNPAKLWERENLHQAHKDYIRAAPFEVLTSGPAFAEDSKNPAAALLVARVDKLAELEEFSDKDPFVQSGVYSSTWLLEWQPSISGFISSPVMET